MPPVCGDCMLYGPIERTRLATPPCGLIFTPPWLRYATVSPYVTNGAFHRTILPSIRLGFA